MMRRHLIGVGLTFVLGFLAVGVAKRVLEDTNQDNPYPKGLITARSPAVETTVPVPLGDGQGAVYLWGVGPGLGLDQSDMATLDPQAFIQPPKPVPGLESGVSWIAATNDHACAIRFGKVLCWGYNDMAQLGNGTREPSTTPVAIEGIENATRVVFGLGNACALAEGTVHCWGHFNSPDHPERVESLPVIPISRWLAPMAQGKQVAIVSRPVAVGLPGPASALGSSCAVVSGEAWCWHSNSRAARNNPLRQSAYPSGISEIVHPCVLKEGGVLCAGSNFYGEAGIGSTGKANEPLSVAQAVKDLGAVVQLESESSRRCALTGGSVKCWGTIFDVLDGVPSPDNVEAEYAAVHSSLQDPRDSSPGIPYSAVPRTLPGFTDSVTHFAMNHSVFCGIAHGKLSCFGSNFNGELGRAWRSDAELKSAAPLPIELDGREARMVAVGDSFGMALVR